MWIGDVAICLFCYLGIVYNWGSGVWWTRRCVFGDCPKFGHIGILMCCVICASYISGAFQKWLDSVWLVWSLETHLSMYECLFWACLDLVLCVFCICKHGDGVFCRLAYH